MKEYCIHSSTISRSKQGVETSVYINFLDSSHLHNHERDWKGVLCIVHKSSKPSLYVTSHVYDIKQFILLLTYGRTNSSHSL
jgi:hypothetical protein